VYSGQCAEFCGIQHAVMRADVDVVTRAEYETFLATHEPGSAAVGREIFEGSCAKCHGLAGQGDIGPKIAGSALLADPQALELLLRQGQRKMPAVGKLWSDDEMKAATDYLRRRFGGG
jgi:mono/diheme cytochrome c family protein